VQYLKSLAGLKKHILLLGRFVNHIIESLDNVSLSEQSVYDLKEIRNRITDFVRDLTGLTDEQLTELTGEEDPTKCSSM
jgi:hypothetical protein